MLRSAGTARSASAANALRQLSANAQSPPAVSSKPGRAGLSGSSGEEVQQPQPRFVGNGHRGLTCGWVPNASRGDMLVLQASSMPGRSFPTVAGQRTSRSHGQWAGFKLAATPRRRSMPTALSSSGKKNRFGRLFRSWGGSSAGRASRSQCEGREFDPPPLHHSSPIKTGLLAGFFLAECSCQHPPGPALPGPNVRQNDATRRRYAWFDPWCVAARADRPRCWSLL